MVTQKGANTKVVGITGNFDDAQSGVKAMFNNKELAEVMAGKGYQFSSANSINIGRLVPQVVYYVYAYTRLLGRGAVQMGERVNFVVPTGNFGNILAAYYARQMGLPVKKLICASNENKVLYDFFSTGAYDRNRPFILTSSPSMDILISSNLERLVYETAGCDAQATAALMKSLAAEGSYRISEEMRARLAPFFGGFATEEEAARKISDTFARCGYVMDTHTAVAAHVCREYQAETKDTAKCVVASTASPYKFVKSVMTAIDERYAEEDEFRLLEELKRVSGTELPGAVREILNADVLHSLECDVDNMEQTVRNLLDL